MDTNYFMDMEKLPMDQFKNILKSKDFLPGRSVLKDEIDERFDLLGSFGIATLSRLKISNEKLLELVQLCDLVRITGVGPVFARIIFDSGICSVKKFMSIDSADLLDILSKTNTDKGLTKVKFGKKDIEYCKELGKYLPLVLEI
jgi:hypothetical protein